ncbi:MAG: hypothetical protein ACYS8K_10855, partial [Planctomycetota bacterium]
MRDITQEPAGRLVLCLLVVAPVLLTPWVSGDGIGYVAYLRSAIVDGDLDLEDEFAYLATHAAADAGGLPGRLLDRSAHRPGIDPRYHTPAPDPVTGRIPSNFSIGPPLAWAPAYTLAHGLAHLGAALGLGGRTDGYGGLYYPAIAGISLLAGVLGLLLAYHLARAAVPPREAFWATLAIAGATSLLYYLYLAPSYSHALTTLTVGAFFLLWHRTRAQTTARTWLAWGVLTGALFLMRWNDVLLVLPAFLFSARQLLGRSSAPLRERLPRCLGYGALALVGFALVAGVQFAVWQYFHGRPWIRHPVTYVQFTPAGLWGTLISARHGLFIWTPITVLALGGILLALRRRSTLAGVALIAFLLAIVSNCTVTDWWAGAAFGMRRLISTTPLLVLGLAVLMDRLRPYGRGWAPLLCITFTLWNGLLMAQYALGMISHTEPVSL